MKKIFRKYITQKEILCFVIRDRDSYNRKFSSLVNRNQTNGIQECIKSLHNL
jgi:hypothetical protein